MKKIVFLVSGRGGSLIFINEAIKTLHLPFEIIAVIADRECNALNYAENNGIFHDIIIYNKNKTEALRSYLLNANPDFIITNIHKIIDEETVMLFKQKMINLHYSLLPSFSGFIGMKTTLAAKEKNCKFIGTTTHFVDEIVDNGEIICQNIFPTDWMEDKNNDDTIFKSGCLNLLNALLIQINKIDISISIVSINEKTVVFSPPLRFDTSKINFSFWEEIKKLA